MNISAGVVLVIVFAAAAVSGQRCAERAKVVPPTLSPETRSIYIANLEVARKAFEANPRVAEELIWLGRRLGYLGEYKEAIKILTQGIKAFPRDARFYRHRGHRMITLRCFDDAVRDLEAAARLISGKPDVTEPDGIPNERNIPTSTLQSNIWYHLGLAHYVKGNFARAVAAYKEAWKVSKNNDMRVATAYWHYMALRRMGRADEAAKLLEPFAGDVEVIENDDYLKLIKLNRGEVTAESLLSTITGEANTLGSASLGYGIGNFYLYSGEPKKAEAVFNKIVSGDQWASFGFIAAEAELKRGTTN
jgi:tetratricopeptide (TPR) repeat protein